MKRKRDFGRVEEESVRKVNSGMNKDIKESVGEGVNKVGAYVRVSTEEQAKEGISIIAQIDRCKAYCVSRGWEVYRIYQDAGFSAGSVKRPAFQDLLNDARSKKFNTLLVYKIDRFSRNMKDLILTLDELKRNNIDFSSVTEQIDTTTAMGTAFFQIIGVFAELERGMVKERVELAFDKKISSGEALHRAPLGYIYKNKNLIVDSENAEKIRQIFDMWLAGIDYKEISKKFEIPVSSLYQVIRNPVYIGKIRYRGRLYKGKHKEIISSDIFYAVNKI